MSTAPSNDPSPRFLPAGAVNEAVVSPAEVEDLLSDITEYDPAANMRLAELEQFDSNSITPELARKRDARRQAGLDGYYDLPPGSGQETAFVMLGMAAIAFVLLGLAVIGVIATTEDSNIYGLAIPFAIPVGFALVGGVAAVRAVRQPLRVTREERAQLRKAHRRTGFEAVGNGEDCGDAQKIAYLADHVIADIGKSAAWKSRLLDEHRIRLDLDRELYEIVSSAAILGKQMRANAVDRDILGGDGPDAERLLQAVKRNAGLISEMRASLVRRVAALLAYRNELAPLDRLIKQMQALDQLEQQEAGLQEAYTQITLNEMATSETTRMSDELTALRANLTAQIEYLRTNVINNPLLSTGLSLTDGL